MKQPSLASLEKQLGHSFASPRLLEQALTHSSMARQMDEPGGDNERLEFLGDAVLGLVSAEALLRRFPERREGDLSKMRAHLVSQPNLEKTAVHLKVGRHLRLGRGEEKTGGRKKAAILADAVEAIAAAIYLDAGLEAARQFVERCILNPELERMESSKESIAEQIEDYKSRLQELLQSHGGHGPVYAIVDQKGPDHCKRFTVEASIPRPEGKPLVTRGSGLTKKQAEHQAARRAYERLTAPTPETQL